MNLKKLYTPSNIQYNGIQTTSLIFKGCIHLLLAKLVFH